MNEQTLKDKLEKLEALFARPGTDGERVAAGLAIERIKARLEDIKKYDPEVRVQVQSPGCLVPYAVPRFVPTLRPETVPVYKATPHHSHAPGASLLCPADLVAGVRRTQPNASRILA